MSVLAHGIGGVRDLPVPATFFYSTAAIVLVVSFVLLGLLWKRPLLGRHGRGRALPDALQGVLQSPALRIALGAASVFLLVLTLSTALLGNETPFLNFAPTFVYVIFWLGLPLVSVLFGNVWTVLSPWRSIADVTVWTMERLGYEARPVVATPWKMGRYPAAVALFAFVALELAHPQPANPRVLGVAVALYSYWALAGMAVFGRDTWTRGGEGFAVAFELLSRIAPFGVREDKVRLRWPFTGLAGAEPVPGTLVFVAVMLGSTSFDGFTRTSEWQDALSSVRERLLGSSQGVIDLATTITNLAGLTGFVCIVVATYLAAAYALRGLVHFRRSLVPDFLLPLVPIAFAYLAAHYFSLFLIQGQFIITLASDPFGNGNTDILGTSDFAPSLTIVSPETVWYVQVASLTIGHVAGLAIAHDRAVTLFTDRRDALRSQYPMLALMILYTVGGLWLLSHG